MRTLPRLLAYFGRYKGRAALALLAMAAVSAATVALLFLLKKVIDDALGAGASAAIPGMKAAAESTRMAPVLRALEDAYASGSAALERAGVSTRFAVPLMLVAALLVKNVFAYLSEFALNSIGLAMVRDLREDAYGSILRQSTRFSTERSSGDLMTRLLSDAEQIQNAFPGGTASGTVGGDPTLRNLTVQNTNTAATAGAVIAIHSGPNGAQNRRQRRRVDPGRNPNRGDTDHDLDCR